MDPTAVSSPSPEISPPSPGKSPPSPGKSPPSPQKSQTSSPHTTTGDFAVDCCQKGEPSSTCRNMDNFRALVLKFAGRLLPEKQSIIEERLDDFFPDELLVPDHPPYADMILTALWELNTEGGSSEEAISNFIRKEYHELPWAHSTILNHHLRDLCVKGEIVMTHDRCYLRQSPIAKPAPSPGPRRNLRLNISPYSSPVSSPSSSPSASLCSSPSSSSSSMCWDSPYQKRKKRLKRKRKNIRGRGRKMIHFSKRGRPRGSTGRGRPPGMTVQVRRRGRAHGITQVSRQVDFVDIDDVNKLEGPKQETEDQNEVLGMDDESEEQYRPQKKQYNIMWIGRGEHIKEKGECVKQRQSGRNQHVSEEQHEEGNKEQDHQRKYNVVWIGRGVRKIKETGRDLLDDNVSEEVARDAEVDAHVEGLNQKEENGASDDIIEKQIVSKELLMSVRNDKIQVEKQEVEMGDEHDSAVMQCEAQIVVASAQKQHGEQIPSEEKPKEGTKEECKPHGQGKEENTKQQLLENQVGMADEPLKSEEIQKESDDEERDSVTIQVGVEAKEQVKPHDDVTEELAHPQEQCIEGAEEEFHQCGQDQLKHRETESAEQEEQQTEVNQNEIGLVRVTELQQDLVMNQSETEVTIMNGVSDVKKDSEIMQDEAQLKGDNEEHSNKSEVHRDQIEKQEAEVCELMNNVSEVTQDLMMIQGEEAAVEGTSVEHIEKQEEQKDENEAGLEKNQSEECKNAVTVQEYLPQEQHVEGIKEKKPPHIQEVEVSEKDPLQENSNFPCESPGVEKKCLPDHKSRPLRQGLRSSGKKEEATPKAENQLERVTPVRRSLRSRKIVSEATATTEGLVHSKEQLNHSGRTRSSKRKPKNAEAEQVSKSQKSGRTDS